MCAGNFTVTAFALDAAGNPSPLSSAWFVYDVTPPHHTVNRTSLRGCSSLDGVVTCNTTAAQFSAACSPEVSQSVTAPCFVQWALSSYTSSASCNAGDEVAGLSWTTTASSASVIDVANAVARAVGIHPTARFVLTSRAADAAGNIGALSTYEWWVDLTPPASPTIVSGPDAVTVSTTATFVVKVPSADASPGQLSFQYRLYVTVGGVLTPYSLAGGNPPFPDPTPVNSAPCTLPLVGLTSGNVYTLSVTAVSQVGTD